MTSASGNAIEVAGLRKAFGSQTVLDGIGFEVPAGTVYSLLGPNGAGKTTTVQILTTLVPADAGEVRIAGFDLARQPQRVRASIGVTGQFSAVDKLLTGQENLQLMADLAHLGKQEGRARTAELLGALRPRRRRRQAGLDLLRRHEAAPGPGHVILMGAPGSSSSWTSPPPAWTPAAGARCGRSSRELDRGRAPRSS